MGPFFPLIDRLKILKDEVDWLSLLLYFLQLASDARISIVS